jgi:hypothetical protein
MRARKQPEKSASVNSNRLHIHAVHAEHNAPMTRATARSIRAAIEELAILLGATEIHYTHLVPAGWRRALR